jgi:membrane-associated HD superfamily phosphohydrolase
MAAFICHFTGNGILSNVLGFKFLSLIFYAGTTIVIALILTHIAPERAVQGVILFAWNPLTLYDTLGNAHNDIVMIFFILLGVYALLRGHYSWALLALTAGGLIKIVPLILLPLAWMTAWSALRGRGRRLRFTFLTGAACVGLTLAAVAPFLNHWDQLKLLPTLTDLYTTSLPAFVEAQLQPHLGLVSSREIVAAADYTLLAGIVIFQTIRIWKAAKVVEEPIRNRSEAASQALVFVRMAAQMLLFYLVFTCAWFQAWYTLWPLALAALLPSGPIPWTAMLLCYAGLWKTPIFNFLLFRSPVNLPPSTVRETLLGPLTLGVVWAYLAAQAVSQQISRSRRPIRI